MADGFQHIKSDGKHLLDASGKRIVCSVCPCCPASVELTLAGIEAAKCACCDGFGVQTDGEIQTLQDIDGTYTLNFLNESAGVCTYFINGRSSTGWYVKKGYNSTGAACTAPNTLKDVTSNAQDIVVWTYSATNTIQRITVGLNPSGGSYNVFDTGLVAAPGFDRGISRSNILTCCGASFGLAFEGSSGGTGNVAV